MFLLSPNKCFDDKKTIFTASILSKAIKMVLPADWAPNRFSYKMSSGQTIQAQPQPPECDVACNDNVRVSITDQLTSAAAVGWSDLFGKLAPLIE